MLQATIVLLGLAASGWQDTPEGAPTPETRPRDRVTQVSVINALMLGQYDGVMAIPGLLKAGNFGVGTLDHLDGELIVLDGKAYQVRGDGAVAAVGDDRSTPFATVVAFEADGEAPCPALGSLAELDTRLDALLVSKNVFAAIRVDGTFDTIVLRSVVRQEPPYRPLDAVAEGQHVWTHHGLEGTLVGIRCPAWVVGLNVPGYHWHFLSRDRKVGGHVLDTRIAGGCVRYDLCRDWEVRLPTSPAFERANLEMDLSRELKRVESSREPVPTRPDKP